MNILIINWRSIKDPLKGGADLATFEHAQKWVENRQANVFWLAPKYQKDIDQEVIAGIKFVYLAGPFRDGLLNFLFQFLKFYISVFLYYLSHFQGRIDVIIDQVHGIPYLTPLYAKEKVIAYIHEVAGNIWDFEFPFPVNLIGKTLEKALLRLFYRKTIFVTGSPSTKKDLIGLGLPEKNIKIVAYGVSVLPIKHVEKQENFTVMFLGRLVKMKGIERALKAFFLLKNSLPEAKMWVAGTGRPEYQKQLERLCQELNIENETIFFSPVSDEEKINLLSKTNVLLNPSYKEGWGLVNLEANRRATPVVAFNVKGNRDSVKDGISGFLVEDNDLAAMAKAILKVRALGKPLQQSALEYSKLFSWEKASDEFYKILQNNHAQ
ncbi:glycosyltransferase family 4 protein [Patescibacteria group bacterium]|nr:glycosyltransferase family 4 protein [Patescibacteria group bacterium]MBU4466996.1 glycosyltransferase family 4 protein [Patescibacteria group bacterium]